MIKYLIIILIVLFNGCDNQTPKTYTMTYFDILKVLPLSLIENTKIEARDLIYQIPLNPMEFIKLAPLYNIPQQFNENVEYNDCDKRVRVFRGWMAQNGYGGVLLMDAAIIDHKNRRHNLIAFIEPEPPHTLRFIEPKEQKMILIEESNKYVILMLIF